MYARRVSMQLKPNSVAELTQRLEKQIIPLLRQQTGFKDELTFVVPGGSFAFAISLWETKENAEVYNAAAYGEVTKILSNLVENTPKVETFEVATSTFHNVAAAAAVVAKA